MISTPDKVPGFEVADESAKHKALNLAPSQVVDRIIRHGQAANRDHISIVRETAEVAPIEWLAVQISRAGPKGLAA
jgi:hypothetical protein